MTSSKYVNELGLIRTIEENDIIESSDDAESDVSIFYIRK